MIELGSRTVRGIGVLLALVVLLAGVTAPAAASDEELDKEDGGDPSGPGDVVDEVVSTVEMAQDTYAGAKGPSAGGGGGDRSFADEASQGNDEV